MNKPRVSLVRCGAYDTAAVAAAVKRSVDLLGGIGAFVRPNEKVLIKPNMLTDAPPEKGVCTHPEVVRAVIRLVKGVTPNIVCGDGPSTWRGGRDWVRVYEACGIKRVCQEEGIPMVPFLKPRMVKGYPLTEYLFSCDRFISVPKFKTHGLTVMTAAVKNLFGLVVGMYKMKLHLDRPNAVEFSKAVVDIYEIRKPDVTILDGILAMEGEGPGTAGTLRRMEMVAASADAVALDTVLAVAMGIRPEVVPVNREAFQRGLGEGEISSLEVIGEDLGAFVCGDFKLPKGTVLNSLPRWVGSMSRGLFLLRPAADRQKCTLCGVCQRACPAEAIAIVRNRLRIDYRKCVLCFCCQEVCPHGAMRATRSAALRAMKTLVGWIRSRT